ncbi:hypothetical protein C0Q70_12413 [Pomacea canaliculata]|uniref:Uncharacterized protein n=1 Tax=Pomacea canaliculata TaxID=400727 RepID=A0A2T7P1F6_POMCA|nr:hypothetical protein C0Q70_12413 [Pomacea canaliculata]
MSRLATRHVSNCQTYAGLLEHTCWTIGPTAVVLVLVVSFSTTATPRRQTRGRWADETSVEDGDEPGRRMRRAHSLLLSPKGGKRKARGTNRQEASSAGREEKQYLGRLAYLAPYSTTTSEKGLEPLTTKTPNRSPPFLLHPHRHRPPVTGWL